MQTFQFLLNYNIMFGLLIAAYFFSTYDKYDEVFPDAVTPEKMALDAFRVVCSDHIGLAFQFAVTWYLLFIDFGYDDSFEWFELLFVDGILEPGLYWLQSVRFTDTCLSFLLFGMIMTTIHAIQNAFIVFNSKYDDKLDLTLLLAEWGIAWNIIGASVTLSIISQLSVLRYQLHSLFPFFSLDWWNYQVNSTYYDSLFDDSYWRFFSVSHNQLVEMINPALVTDLHYVGTQLPSVITAIPAHSINQSVIETFIAYSLTISELAMQSVLAQPVGFIDKLTGCRLGDYTLYFTDGLSLWLLWLTFSVMYIAHLTILSESKKTYSEQFVWVGAIHVLVLFCFITKDLLHFFFAFEALLIPLFYLIGRNGSRSERSRAAFFLLVFTLVGSIFLWYAVLYSTFIIGCTRVDLLATAVLSIDEGTCSILWWCLFLGFAFKVPLVPFHLWLTVAHVEAPTVGSILLAGLILKLGGYGMIRFILLVFPVLSDTYSSAVITICCVGYTFATLSAIRQLDIKRFVAYTSIAHMNFGLAVLFTVKEVGFMAFCHTMISHGIIASGLFFLVGFVYRQVGLRDALYLRGLANVAPYFAMFWFIFSMANVGMPLLSGFPGEFYGMIALAMTNRFVVLAFAVGFYFTAVYTFLNVSRVLFGSPSRKLEHGSLLDLTVIEYQVVLYLVLWSLILGMFPDIVFNTVGLDAASSLSLNHSPFLSTQKMNHQSTEHLRYLDIYQKTTDEFRVADVRYNLMHYEPKAKTWVFGSHVQNLDLAQTNLLSTLDWATDISKQKAGIKDVQALYRPAGISFLGTVFMKESAKVLLDKDLYLGSDNNALITDHPIIPSAYQRYIFNSDCSALHHIEDWFPAADSLVTEAVTGLVLDTKSGIVVTDRRAHAPSLYLDLVIRGNIIEPADASTPSSTNTYIVTQSNTQEGDNVLINFGKGPAAFGKKNPRFIDVLFDNIRSYLSPNATLRQSERSILRSVEKWKTITTDPTFAVPLVRTGENTFVVPASYVSKFNTPSTHETMSIYTRNRPSILSEVYPAEVVFPKVDNKTFVERAQIEKNITIKVVHTDAKEYIDRYSK